MANGKGKKIVSKSPREGVKMYRADKAKKAKAAKKGKKEVVAHGYSDISKYKASKAGYYDTMKSIKGDKGGKKDYNRIPFRNKDIDRITSPKMTKPSYGDYIKGLD